MTSRLQKKKRLNAPVPKKPRQPVEITQPDLEELAVDAIELSIYSDAEVRRDFIQVTSVSTEPTVAGSLMDLSMGVLGKEICPTCQNDKTQRMECRGHPGYYYLPIYYIKPIFVDTVINLLTAVCRSCGQPILSDEQLHELAQKYQGHKLLSEAAKMSKKRACRVAPSQLAKLADRPMRCSKNEELVGVSDYPKNNYQIMTKNGSVIENREILETFQHISPEHARLLGFTGSVRPQDLLSNLLIIIPACYRPVTHQNGKITSHPMTNAYRTIIKLAEEIKQMSQQDNRYKGAVKDLNDKIYQLVMSKSDRTTGRDYAAVSIFEEISGKQGVLRDALMAKQTKMAARAVAGPGIDLASDQVGVPEEIARRLTRSVVVNSINFNRLRNLWRDFQVRYIEYAGRHGTYEVDENRQRTEQPNIGDTLHVRLQNDDYIIVHRYPTLHRGSMVAFRVKIVPGMTIQLPLSVTGPFNADFDGDELMLYVPQGPRAEQELETIMGACENLATSGVPGPQYGLVFDALTMAPVLSGDSVRVNADLFEQLFNRVTTPTKDTFMERLDASGKTYRYRVYQADIPDQASLQRWMEQYPQLITLVVNPPEEIDFDKVVYNNDPVSWIELTVESPSEEIPELVDVDGDPVEIELVEDQYTGKALFSLALPAGLYLKRTGSQYQVYTSQIAGDSREFNDILEVLQQLDVPYRYSWIVDLRYLETISGKYQIESSGPGEIEVMITDDLPPDVPVKWQRLSLLAKDQNQNVKVLVDGYPGLGWKMTLEGTPDLLIQNGILVEGNIRRSDVAAKPGSIIDYIMRDPSLGNAAASQLVTNLPWITDQWGKSYGFSIGLEQCKVNDTDLEIYQKALQEAEVKIAQLGEPPSDQLGLIKYEEEVAGILNRATDVSQIMRKLDPNNFIRISSKGNEGTFRSIMLAVGQSYFQGKRLGGTGRRLYPIIHPEYEDIFTRGYVTGNFMKGDISLLGYISTAAGTREGLISKALGTAVTGYHSNLMMHALQNLVVDTIGAVRNIQSGALYQRYANGTLFEFGKTVDGMFFDIDYLVNRRDLLE